MGRLSKNLPCSLCGSCKPVLVQTIQEQRIAECSDCGFVCGLDQPDRFEEIYEGDYFKGSSSNIGYSDYDKDIDSNIATFKRRLERAEKKLGCKGVLLDFGCAYGHMALTAQKMGWKVVAVDISLEAVQHAQKKYMIRGIVADLSNPALKHEIFDLICLYDVLEHVINPIAVLDKLRPLLKPSGLIHIATPDQKSVSAKFMRSKWYHYKPNEHLCYFSKRTLRMALVKTGWKIDQIKALPSHMTLDAIFKRLEHYSKSIFSKIRKLLAWGRMGGVIVKLPVGEMEAWAGPIPREATLPPLNQPEMDLEDFSSFLTCSCCSGSLVQTDDQKLSCEQCNAEHPVINGIPVMIRQKSDPGKNVA